MYGGLSCHIRIPGEKGFPVICNTPPIPQSGEFLRTSVQHKTTTEDSSVRPIENDDESLNVDGSGRCMVDLVAVHCICIPGQKVCLFGV